MFHPQRKMPKRQVYLRFRTDEDIISALFVWWFGLNFLLCFLCFALDFKCFTPWWRMTWSAILDGQTTPTYLITFSIFPLHLLRAYVDPHISTVISFLDYFTPRHILAFSTLNIPPTIQLCLTSSILTLNYFTNGTENKHFRLIMNKMFISWDGEWLSWSNLACMEVNNLFKNSTAVA